MGYLEEWKKEVLRERAKLTVANARIKKLTDACEAVQHNRTCSCYSRVEDVDMGGRSPPGPCARCKIGYDQVDAVLKKEGEDGARTQDEDDGPARQLHGGQSS